MLKERGWKTKANREVAVLYLYTCRMKISLHWLQDFITLKEKDPQAIARRVTAGVAEVDDVEILGGLLDRCCVGKVLSVNKHPNADRLSLCDVRTDAGTKRVVCGGSNLRAGMRVAFAHVGARVKWHGTEMMTLERTKIRGEDSEGMICAAAELGLEAKFPAKDEKEIVDLGDGDESVGASLKEHLGLDDVVLHIDNHAITHRADLFSHVGFAREFVALGLGKWNKSDKGNKRDKRLKFPKASLPFRCIVDRKDLVPRYSSCLLEIDGLGETPKWMRARLEATGWRCVSLPVDITNYVAMETGMPLHSFDADDIRGDFHIRTAKPGETITTLDEVDRVLPEGAIVLSDREGIFDLLGIMGGLRSSTKESTRRVYLHAAIADPVSIRKAIIATGHRTEAGTVYEKGIPRGSATIGLLRAVELFLQLVPGARVVSTLEDWGDDGKAKAIPLSLERVSSVLGVEIPPKKVVAILEDLEFSVKKGAKTLSVTPPLHRLGDIRGPHDLIEEIGRVFGYDRIPSTLPDADVRVPRRDPRIHRMREALKAEAYAELVPLCLVSETTLKKCGLDPAVAVEIGNPLGEELKLLSASVLPGLLENAQRNFLRIAAPEMLKTFTLSRVFHTGGGERAELGMLMAATRDPKPGRALLDDPFLLLKRDCTLALQSAGYRIGVAPSGNVPTYAHGGRCAELFVAPAAPAGHDARAALPVISVGTIFEIHPSIRLSFDLPHRTAAALVDMTALLSVASQPRVASSLPQFPAVEYDVTLPLRSTGQAGAILGHLRGGHELLEQVEVKDIYAASGSDQYNLTLTFTYRAHDRTLTEEEAKQVHEKVLQMVQ